MEHHHAEHADEAAKAETAAPESLEAGKGFRLNTAPLTVPSAIIWNGLMISVAIIAAALILSYGSFSSNPNNGSDAAESAMAPDIRKVSTESDPFIGKADAPVTIAYWSDYQCPFCKQFEVNTLPGIVREYVSTGKVKVVFKDFAFLGEDSTTAAFYSRAVWHLYPEQYFAWHEAMYAAQDAENGGFGDEPSVRKLTDAIDGIDASAVVRDIEVNAAVYQKEIDADREEALKFGIQGTPSFITGKNLIPGVAALSAFQNLIDPQLK